ncbi:MAG: FAD:protein FMN transferase [Pseudomonadota bacterium]
MNHDGTVADEPVVLVPPAAPLRAAPRGAVLHRLHGQSMGSTWRLVLAAEPAAEQALAAWQHGVQATLDRVVAQMSHWETGSELSRFNRLPAGQAQALSPGFSEVMRCALQLAAASGGAFDPAMGAAIEAWGFGPARRFDSAGFEPPAACAADRAAGGGWQALQLQGARLRQPGGCRLDLSAIAKGHAVDNVAAWLRGQGRHHFLFELGGELVGEGLKPDGQPWWVAIERPPHALSLPPLRAALAGHALATSGDYRQGFTDREGRWCSHTLDPRSGEPVRHALASVSVLHERCMQADALATVLFVLGPEEGNAWADANGVAAWFVARTPGGGWREWPSAALKVWLDA